MEDDGDDDNSSVSSKSQCEHVLANNDMRKWLKHHNQNVLRRYEHHLRNERQRKILLHSLHSEENPQEALEGILNLTIMKKPNRLGKVTPINASECSHAVSTMMQDSSLNERYHSGVNPSTLLAEQRRKILLNALTDVGYVTEKPEDSKAKVTELLQTRAAAETAKQERNVARNAERGRHSNVNQKKLRPLTGSRPIKQEISSSAGTSSPEKFRPKWDHYDTMRTRWSYIQPQVKHLVDEQDMLAPRRNQKYMKVDPDTVLVGNVNDIRHYESLHENRSFLDTRISTHSKRMQDARIKKANTYYIPSPCVYY
mmetsp:Transcript_25813/g.43330  ORF Transcript_25813/g.43330 Transcript_25813/m.43330 type:complete len:312 (-) Transcript_25813:230-1165(-)